MSVKYEIDPVAYMKALYHAFKHPAQPVNGVLTGQFDGESKTLRIADCYPLFHSIQQIATLPLLEAALMQIDQLSEKKKHKIVGYYFANERLNDKHFGSSHKSVAQKLHSLTPHSCTWMIDNELLTPESDCVAIKVLENSGKGSDGDNWHPVGDLSRIVFCAQQQQQAGTQIPHGTVIARVRDDLENAVFRTVVDFDEYLDHPQRDYRNTHVTWK